ncbi:hypothetical protein BJY59DRAFT_471261 [Rhodotorula toruloides]
MPPRAGDEDRSTPRKSRTGSRRRARRVRRASSVQKRRWRRSAGRTRRRRRSARSVSRRSSSRRSTGSNWSTASTATPRTSNSTTRNGTRQTRTTTSSTLVRFTPSCWFQLTLLRSQWLDEGDGKDLDLEECPRKRLESECITYLTAEQREMYRVEVKDGLLVWAKDGQPLDTSKYHEDRGPDKGGIVAISEEEYEENRRKENEKMKKLAEAGQGDISSSDYDSSSSSSSSDEADEVREGVRAYGDKGGTAGHGKGVRQAKERVRYYLSPKAVMDTMLRKTVNKNTWLYVSDLQNNLYVGIKKTGSFQHSSFLYGARVTSAGAFDPSRCLALTHEL